MKKTICIFVLVLTVLALCCAMPGGAFDGNDYDGGGGGDWDGGDGGWDSDDGYSGDGGDLEVGTVIFLMVVITVIVVYSGYAKKKTAFQDGGAVRPSSNQGLHVNLPDRTAQIEGIIKGHDPNFSASDFISFAKRVYIDIQTAWCKRDLSVVRVFLHDNLYDATVRQIQAKIEQGVVYHYESMVVNTAYPTSYARDGQFEYLTLYLNARMIDWQEDEKTGKILRGDKTTRWDLRYKMKFMRSAGVLTKEATSRATEHSCPNCGAPIAMMSSAKCEYCGAAVTTGQYSWVLSDFGTIRNDTIDEGIRTQ